VSDLEKQFQADCEAIEEQWQEAQPLVQKMLSDWRVINEEEMGVADRNTTPREGEKK
jgi:hypothetical protein